MMARKRRDWLVAKIGDDIVMMSRGKTYRIGITKVEQTATYDWS
jgi:hypothetical protein